MGSIEGDPSAPLLVINPRASRLSDPAARAALVEQVARAVRARTGREPWPIAGSQADARVALERLTDPPLVVAIGGDGTVREVAATLSGQPIPLAIVPRGTGNVLAASLGIRGVSPALDAIRRGIPRTIDLGAAEWGRPGVSRPDGQGAFLVAAGVGLDARIMAAATDEWKRRLRFGAYVGATLRELTRLAAADFAITADGELLQLHGHLALVANAGQIIPGRVGPRQPIDPGDGRLDLLFVGGRGAVAGLRSATELLLRTGELRGAVIRRTVREVHIEAEPAHHVQTDGDPHAPGWLTARVVPAAIRVLVSPSRSTHRDP
jgi:diacylglycerol kinase family enzyme